MGAGISGGSCIELSSVDRQDAAKLNATTTHAPTNGPKIPNWTHNTIQLIATKTCSEMAKKLKWCLTTNSNENLEIVEPILYIQNVNKIADKHWLNDAQTLKRKRQGSKIMKYIWIWDEICEIISSAYMQRCHMDSYSRHNIRTTMKRGRGGRHLNLKWGRRKEQGVKDKGAPQTLTPASYIIISTPAEHNIVPGLFGSPLYSH